MNDKMREALEALDRIIFAKDARLEEFVPWVLEEVKRAREVLATPPTEQTGRVMDLEEAKKVISAFAAMNGYSVDFVPMAAPAVSLPSVETLLNQLSMAYDFLTMNYSDPALLQLAERISEVGDDMELLADRLDKPMEVDLSHWAKTQGFDAWAADHAAVLRNLKAYLQSVGVRVIFRD